MVVSRGLQEREEMRGVSWGDDVRVAEEQATSYRAEGSANRWEGDEEVVTFRPREGEGPRFHEDLVAQLYREGVRA